MVRREQRISQPRLKSVGCGWGNNVPAPRRRLSPVVQKTAVPKTSVLVNHIVFSRNSFLKQLLRCTLHTIPVPGRCGGVRSCLFLLVLPSIQTVLSAPDFHRFGLSCGRASLAESWRPAWMRRFVRFLPACESGSRAVTAGSEFHRPRSTMSISIMPQRTQLV